MQLAMSPTWQSSGRGRCPSPSVSSPHSSSLAASGTSIASATKARSRARSRRPTREPTAVELQEATSWNDKTLTIANRQLRDVLSQLKRWYGVDIKVPDLTLLDRRVTLQASLDSPKEAITGVEQSANVKFGYEGK